MGSPTLPSTALRSRTDSPGAGCDAGRPLWSIVFLGVQEPVCAAGREAHSPHALRGRHGVGGCKPPHPMTKILQYWNLMISAELMYCLVVLQIIAAESWEFKPLVKISSAFSDGFKPKEIICGVPKLGYLFLIKMSSLSLNINFRFIRKLMYFLHVKDH